MNTKAHPDYTNSINEWNTRLFVTDWKPRSVLDYGHLNRIYAEHLRDKCNIEVIDLLEHPEVVRKEKMVAVPTPVKTSPKPELIMVGDFADQGWGLKGLGLEPVKTQ